MLDQALRGLVRSADPNLLVGFENADDAAVYQLTPELALVQTADFFTPIVDDPFAFGQIAAANALSDIYAMGGRPITALSLVGFPGDAPPELLAAILAGGQSKLDEAGCALAGGHSVRDQELKFGFAVTGLIHPQRIWRNGGALPGDVLVLKVDMKDGGVVTGSYRVAATHARYRVSGLADAMAVQGKAPPGAEQGVALTMVSPSTQAALSMTGGVSLQDQRKMELWSDPLSSTTWSGRYAASTVAKTMWHKSK